MNTLLNNLVDETNFKLTENGALAHKTTKSAVLDMFALCGAYRSRSDEDCILMFKNAFEENPELALKCLFYLRDIRGGQGERRYFRVCFQWFCNNYPEIARKNLDNISFFGRWDDLIYACIGTKVEKDALAVIRDQLALDVQCKTPSLLAKWLPSENASAISTRIMGKRIRDYLGITSKQYRKMLADLRSRINIVEKLMSENRWDEIKFDKIPSKAGLIYKNAFARRDIIAKKYEEFAKDETTKVNADSLYPYEIIKKAINDMDIWGGNYKGTDTDRAMLEKYWENQIDVLEGKPCKMMCVVDTSGSMASYHGLKNTVAPIDIAIGLGMYCAERVGGPFKDHYISFSSRPQLIKVEGVDFVDKVLRIYQTNLCENTNLAATFDLLLKASLSAKPEDRLDTIIVISDMEIDYGCYDDKWSQNTANTEMEVIRKKWNDHGLECPKLVYWNVAARNNTILDLGSNVSFVSGASPMIFKQVATGKTGWDLMMEVLGNERYSKIVL